MRSVILVCLAVAAFAAATTAEDAALQPAQPQVLDWLSSLANFNRSMIEDDDDDDEDNSAADSDEDDDDDEEDEDEEAASNDFGLTDLDDPEDDEDVENRRRRHHHCWRQCVVAGQCHHNKKDFEDEATVANNASSKCPAKVHRCDSCLLDCKARFVKCGAEAMKLTVEQVRKGSEQMATAALCDKCDLKKVMKACKPHKAGEDSEEDDDIETDVTDIFTLGGDDDEDMFELTDEDLNNFVEGDDEKFDFFRALHGGESSEDDDLIIADRKYNVTADLEGRWRPRKCEIPVKKIPANKRKNICTVSKCIVEQAQKSTACTKNAAPVLEMYQKAFDKIFNCKAVVDEDDDDSGMLGEDDHDYWNEESAEGDE